MRRPPGAALQACKHGGLTGRRQQAGRHESVLAQANRRTSEVVTTLGSKLGTSQDAAQRARKVQPRPQSAPKRVEPDTARKQALELFEAAKQHEVPRIQERLMAAIQAENEDEVKAVRALFEDRRLASLQREGLVLLHLKPQRAGSLFSSPLLAFRPPKGEHLPKNKFQKAARVLISFPSAFSPPGNPTRGRPRSSSKQLLGDEFEGDVMSVSAAAVTVALQPDDADALEQLAAKFAAQGSPHCARLDRLPKRNVTSQRQLAALAQMGEVGDADNDHEVRARLLVLSHASSPNLSQQSTKWAQRTSWRAAAKASLLALHQQGKLNKSQAAAIAACVTRTAVLWQGPPGTGKTNTLVGLIKVLVTASSRTAADWAEMGAVLACSDTNAAADNLAAGCRAAGLRVVRVGNPAVVQASLQDICLEALAGASFSGRRAAGLQERADAAMAKANVAGAAAGSSAESRDADDLRRAARRLRGQAAELMAEASSDVLSGVQVVAATCAACEGRELSAMRFKMVVLDEATQATEASSLLPLLKGAESFVLAGDPQQLPPTIVSGAASALELDKTLFERLQEGGIQAKLLRVQYRMHPGVADFPNRWFYGGRLLSGVREDERALPRGLQWPPPTHVATAPDGTPQWHGMPVVLVNADHGREVAAAAAARIPQHKGRGATAERGGGVASGGRARDADARSFANPVEAELAVSAAAALCRGGDVRSIALLAPYKAQVAAISELLQRHSQYFDAFKRTHVAVSSVDGYQGREADVVIFSATRNNSRKSIGFVSDPRRLNVAITRPKRGLIVVGSPSTLEGDPNWGRWLSWCRKYAAIVPAKWLPAAPWVVDQRGQ